MMEASNSAANDAPASSHMCQISAKPNTSDRPEITTPAPVLAGMWMGWKPVSGRW